MIWLHARTGSVLVSTGRDLSERLLARRILVKDTHGATIRIAPPLVASEADIDLIVSGIDDSLRESAGAHSSSGPQI